MVRVFRPGGALLLLALSSARAAFADPPASPETDTSAVEVHGTRPVARGLGDLQLNRDLLDASPRQQTSEMLSAAPGFFVDHEDGEGLGNDVFLRGFDLDHGSGIEMSVGGVPINAPTHILGQGYADANFIIPEVVHGIHVLEGTYDPHQGDAAIVGSADFELGVAERGYQVAGTYGSFGQSRVLGIAAPRGADEQTFLAFSARNTNGFGQDRQSQSGSVNAQYGVDLGASDHLRLLATAYGVKAGLAGVVRQDDVNAGRIGYYDAYGALAQNQSVQSSRVVFSADFEHLGESGGRFEIQPWVMLTDLRTRQNFTGSLESSQIDPTETGRGDLFQSTNTESAIGLDAHSRTGTLRLGNAVAIVAEPGVYARYGHSNQTRSLLVPDSLETWDRRVDAGLETLDVGGFVDFDVRLGSRIRISGGPRIDVLSQSVDDRLANVVPVGSPSNGAVPGERRGFSGVAAGPRVTGRFDVTSALSTQVSYGEGFRSLDGEYLVEGRAPYSKVRSLEAGVRAEDPKHRYVTTLAAFDTWVENELVFVPDAGGYEAEGASTRRGVVGSFLARPAPWFLASTALSVTDAMFNTLVPGVSHHVPSVPPLLFRADVTARGKLVQIHERWLTGRIEAGYTFLSGRHLTDTVVGPVTHVLNTGGALRYGAVEIGVDAYNLLGLRYADDAQVYVSNWSTTSVPKPASFATHVTAAPPRVVLGTVTVHF